VPNWNFGKALSSLDEKIPISHLAGPKAKERERERHRESLGQFHFPAFPCSWCNLAIPPPPIAVVGIATAKENGNTLNFRSLSLLPLGV